jgi:glycosyltransferase involved in cell wall biosynthesis
MSKIEPHELPVIFLSYFYPPCTLTGANRIKGWIPHLREHGIYPIVITRHWEEKVYTETELLKHSGKVLDCKYHSWGEEHFVPFFPTLRDRLFVNQQFSLFRRALSIAHLTLGTTAIQWNETGFLEAQLKHVVEKHGNIKGLFISANPFFQFHLGYRLNKKYNIPWIADYRDDWTTNELTERKGIINNWLLNLHSYSEKKWLKTASCFTTVSDKYKLRLERFLGIKGYTIMNGFSGNPRPNNPQIQNKLPFTILYSGTLYPSQDIESLLPCVCETLAKFTNLDWNIHFQGLDFSPEQTNRVKKAMPEKFHNKLITSPRKPLEVAIPEIQNANVLLLPVYGKNTGIPTSKIFDYLAARRPVLIYPGDSDIIDKLAAEWDGFEVCRDISQVKEMLTLWANLYLEGIEPKVVNPEITLNYSRKAKSKELADIIKHYFH